MQSIFKRTALGLATQAAIKQLQLQKYRDILMSNLFHSFNNRFQQFKRNHNTSFPSITIKGNYVIDNQFPIGENDKQQYFKCLGHNIRIGNNFLAYNVDGVKKNFTIVEGFSRNQVTKKRTQSKSVNRRRPSNKESSRSADHSSGLRRQKKE